jgi:hypothetical protein
MGELTVGGFSAIVGLFIGAKASFISESIIGYFAYEFGNQCGEPDFKIGP